MDRREALKRLGAAGAIVVGGSAVLSSNSVAYAASGVCIAVIPDPVDFRITQPTNRARVQIRYEPGGVPGSSISYRWSNAQILAGTGGVRIRNGATSNQVTLERRTAITGGTSRNWTVGDQYSVLLTVTWSCTRPTRTDTAGYLVTATYAAGTLPVVAIVSVPRFS